MGTKPALHHLLHINTYSSTSLPPGLLKPHLLGATAKKKKKSKEQKITKMKTLSIYLRDEPYTCTTTIPQCCN